MTFFKDAKYEAKGKFIRVTFPWRKQAGGRNRAGTTLGIVAIDGKDLTVDVNSLKRAKKIEQLIKRHLGQDAVFKGAVSQSAEQLLRHRAALQMMHLDHPVIETYSTNVITLTETKTTRLSCQLKHQGACLPQSGHT